MDRVRQYPGMLGVNQYGKAETHLVRVVRDGDVHELRDLLVSVSLSGALEAVHLEGDNRAVLATDTQKNTVYAFAQEFGVGTPEEFALLSPDRCTASRSPDRATETSRSRSSCTLPSRTTRTRWVSALPY